MEITKVENNTFLNIQNVQMQEVSVQDEMIAAQISGATEGYSFMLALLAQICIFDGKKLTMEDLRHLKSSDFLELLKVLSGKKQQDLEKMSSF